MVLRLTFLAVTAVEAAVTHYYLRHSRTIFGCADAATVISRDTALADAAATTLGSAVRTNKMAIEECVRIIDELEINGAPVILGEGMARKESCPRDGVRMWGVKRITKGSLVQDYRSWLSDR